MRRRANERRRWAGWAERRGHSGGSGAGSWVPADRGARGRYRPRVWNRLPWEGVTGTDEAPQRRVRSGDSPASWPERRPPVGRARPSAPPIAGLQRGGTRSTVGRRREAQTEGCRGNGRRCGSVDRSGPGVLGEGAGSGAGAAGAAAPSGMAPRHVPVAPCPLCSEQQLPSPARCLGRTRWFSCWPLPWSRGIGNCCPPGKERSGRWRASTVPTMICLRSRAASQGEGGAVTVTLLAG